MKDLKVFIETQADLYVGQVKEIIKYGEMLEVPISSEMAWDMVKEAVNEYRTIQSKDQIEKSLKGLMDLMDGDFKFNMDDISDDDIPF